MREIKFRAWTANTWVAEQWNIKMIYDYQDTTLTEVYGFNSEELPVMQFTGLKDKNGKGIYEGDIYHQGDSKITYTVVWHDTGLIGKRNGSSSYAGLSHWQDRIEVIGNIYEHSHLLDK